MRGNKRQFDIFWSSSPEAFEILERNGAFASNPCGSQGPPAVALFAISGVGWANHQNNTVFTPSAWNDLLHNSYRGKIAMARPARSGSTHLLVESLLQIRGWEDGRAYFLELTGNLSTLTARSYGVPDGLVSGRFKIGFTIDYLSQSRPDELRFSYGRPVMIIPAKIGILDAGLNSKAACEFVGMVLSRTGQIELMSPEVARIPADPVVREQFESTLPIEIVQALRLKWLDYDASKSTDRYWAVNTLFDLMIAESLSQRRDLWRQFNELPKDIDVEPWLDRFLPLATHRYLGIPTSIAVAGWLSIKSVLI